MPLRKRTPLNEHASIKALMGEASAGEKAEDVIRRKCRGYVTHAKSMGWSGPSFDPRFLASMLGIRVEEMPEPWDGDGRIFPRAGQTIIEYRPDQTIERQRFTICHEIAHTCFPDYFEFVRRYDLKGEEGTSAHRRFERLCNVGAGELLMPHQEFQADLAGRKICFQETCSLGARYGASVDATVRRLLDFTDHPCGVAFLTDQGFEKFNALPERFRVRWFWKTKTFRGYVPTGTLLPKGTSLLHSTLQEDGFKPSARETWFINNAPRSWYIEGLRMPPIPQNPSYPCVIALLHSRQQH